MERHDFIVSTLVQEGFRTSLKGFYQFCRCVELFTDNKIATIESVYERVAKDFGCTKSAVEKNLRRFFMSSDAQAIIGRLFDMKFGDRGNKEIVATFCNYVDLQRKRYE